METSCVRCIRKSEVLNNSFKQTLHRMNQPYLIWAAVFICFRLGHTVAPSGNWVPIVDAIRVRLLYPDGVAHEDEVQPANYID